MGITLFLRGASGSSTWPADNVLLRFDRSQLDTVELLNGDNAVYPGGPISADAVSSLEGSQTTEFVVRVEDAAGKQQGRFQAVWLKLDFPFPGNVAFHKEALQDTGYGLKGRANIVSLNAGELAVQETNISDGR